ncbi:acryloyl-CoA reductase [Peptoniphilus stercorisuis]|uniref:Alkylation response protein AidB-like acyl-CoA dehydrogenase n=1 Tax=Peptoniphilus stercorisuis TaxID=1436965 RepID=A0ABS4KD23_9FIRM|nr:acryloyl-CoA reductase [Peptoniphilus stercorisuis]MBP2025260.1 alkylation response protein AidB-like acyl-CoA dehydrogenase [Peptoniphilus stercorisuis]
MKITFNQAEEKIREVAREFSEKEIAPLAEELDKEARYPEESFQKMVKLGFTGIGVPEEYGGSGGNEIVKCIVVEEIAKKCASTAGILSIHGIFGQAILRFGTEEQKQQYLPEVTSGGKHGAFALTEPNAGSDAGAVKTHAFKNGDNYIINGTKCFITGGANADYVLVFALTDPSKGLKGMSAIIVPKNTPGFKIGKTEDKMGIRASETSELIFDNCKVPTTNLVGKEGQGFKIAMIMLDGARIGVAAQALGIAKGAIDESVKYMHERVQFGKPIAALQGLQWYIADMATKTEASKWLIYRAASLKDEGQPYSTEAAMAKLNASENARIVTNLALQIHGGYGYMKDYPLERMCRDAKITEIYEGTSEIHKVVIARAVIG